METFVITGVSTGIGRVTAELLLSKGFHVFGSVRSEKAGAEIATALGKSFTPLVFDVTDEKAIQKAVNQVKTILNGRPLSGLINNAGIAVGGPLQHLPVADFRQQLEVNLVGPLLVTQAFLPLLGAVEGFTGKPGRIVNLSSVAGRLAFPFLGPYAISKHGIEAFSDALRRELKLFGVDVIVVAPGAVATPIWDKAEQSDIGSAAGTPYEPAARRFTKGFVAIGRKGFPASVIAKVIEKALTSARPRARYAVVPQYFSRWLVPLLLPKRRLDQILAKNLGL